MCPNHSELRTQNLLDTFFEEIAEWFIVERKSRGLAKGTLSFYEEGLKFFGKYLEEQSILTVGEITAQDIRQYLFELGKRRNPGGVHSHFRTIRAFFNWIDFEFEPDNWRNPIKKVRPPEIKHNPLPGVSIDDLQAMIDACYGSSRNVERDRAILSFLFETGVRGSEFCALQVSDLDQITGAVTIRNGKGRTRRTVYLGRKVLRMVRKYLRNKDDLRDDDPIFATYDGNPFSFSGLRQLVRRRAEAAGIKEPGLHDFRRGFALQCMRNGMDILTVSRLLGHSSVSVTQVYIAQDESDLQQSLQKFSPMDNM